MTLLNAKKQRSAFCNVPMAPKKRFGQNFLIDESIVQRILQAIAPQPQETLVEIGPGQGALTLGLLRLCKKLIAIEMDKDLIEPLRTLCESLGTLTLYQQDALQFNFSKVNPFPLRIVGNLPYNISTPLLFHLLKQSQYITDMHFMLQKEVVDRMVAAPHHKDYGRLSIMIQYGCKTQSLFTVPPTAFQPQPKVQSAFVRLIPYKTLPHKAQDEKLFAALVNTAFSQRRKMLRKSLAFSAELFEAAHITPSLRPENLSVADFVRLSNRISQQGNSA